MHTQLVTLFRPPVALLQWREGQWKVLLSGWHFGDLLVWFPAEDWQGFEAEGTMGLDSKGENMASAESQTSAMKMSPSSFQLAVLTVLLIRLADNWGMARCQDADADAECLRLKTNIQILTSQLCWGKKVRLEEYCIYWDKKLKTYQGVFIKGLNMNHELLMKALGEHVVIMFMCFHYASAIVCVCMYVCWWKPEDGESCLWASSLLFLSMIRYHGVLTLRTQHFTIPFKIIAFQSPSLCLWL